MKKCVIIINTFNPDAAGLAVQVQKFLQERNVIVSFYEFSSSNVEQQFNSVDFAVTLGGDGTVLFAARSCAPYNVPVFPINLGKFGFIAGIKCSSWQADLDSFLKGLQFIAERSMVQASIVRKSNGNNASVQCSGAGIDKDDMRFHETAVFSASALNEIVVSCKDAARIVSLQIECMPSNSEKSVSFGRFRSDGVIIATATGATAYCAAAGGPIVDPSLDVFVLNPICPFSLSNRPIVLPSDMLIEVTVLPSRGVGVILSIDGQITADVHDGDRIIIQRAEKKALLAGCDSTGFYNALRSKLNWSGSTD